MMKEDVKTSAEQQNNRTFCAHRTYVRWGKMTKEDVKNINSKNDADVRNFTHVNFSFNIKFWDRVGPSFCAQRAYIGAK